MNLDDLFEIREQNLQGRFPGHYRAIVVETNDPLNMGRIRFKVPELHDYNLAPDDCPWAVPCPSLGGPNAGSFTHPCIGDFVWIAFEKQHPYAPVWVGFANPTRLNHHVQAQVTQKPIQTIGTNLQKPLIHDSDNDFLPLDGRPMSTGVQDRYGNLDLMSSVGFFPKTHDHPPPSSEFDAITNTKFNLQSQKPMVNSPDRKYMAKVTKYGNMMVLGDQGYLWKSDGESKGEFTGDFVEDNTFENKRWLYLQKVLNEGRARNTDQRRITLQTRYGHKIELRDVGWAQPGPMPSKSRPNEYGPAVELSAETVADQRWIKIRTKGGMLFQASDKGFDPENDTYIRKSALLDAGFGSEREDKYWYNKDSRWIRISTRWGIKFVLDDRGSDSISAESNDSPRGNGILLKGRRSPGSKANGAAGDPRGFFWQINENDQLNNTMWGSPLGQVIEINDRYQYVLLSSSLGPSWSPKWRGVKENEFCRRPAMIKNPEITSHHLKIDHDNDYIRFKTRAGNGAPADLAVNPSGVGEQELNQGFEARDGSLGDGPWVELVDCQNRGLWFSKRYQLGIWRGKNKKRLYQWFDDDGRKIAIYNGETSGVIDIYCSGSVNIIADGNVNLRSDQSITIKSQKAIALQAGSTKFTISDVISTNVPILAPQMMARFVGAAPGNGAGTPRSGGVSITRLTRPKLPDIIQPSDRAKTYNSPFEECPQDEIEHPNK